MVDDRDRRYRDEPLSAPRRSRSARGGQGPADSRQRRLAADRSRRRRRTRQRALILLVLVLFAVAAYFGVSRVGWGGDDAEGRRAQDPGIEASEAVLLTVSQEGETKVAAVVSPGGQPGLLVGLPGDVLVRASSGFAPLRSFLDSSQDPESDFESAAEGVEAILGTTPVAWAQVEWADLRDLAARTDPEAVAPAMLGADDEGAAAAVVDALLALLIADSEEAGDVSLDDLTIEGDHDTARASLRALAPAPEVSGALPGRAVEGLGFAYYEPDVAAVRAMLGGRSPEAAVSVEVQNGSGVVGAAQKISDVIAPLGYTLLPPKNAEGFPDVADTQLFAASDAVGQADRLRGILGVGTVVEQESLPPRMIVIVVGKDLDLDALGGPEG